MPIDKVKPLKIENPANGGTQTDIYPTEVTPTADYLSTKGLAFDGQEAALIYSSSSAIQFVDVAVTSPKSLFTLQHATGNLFNATTANGFAATAVQEAIEEAKTSAVGRARYALTLFNNGSYSNPQWIGYDSLIPGNNTPIIVPRACTIKELTFSNTNSNCQFTVTIRKDSTTAATSLSWPVSTGASNMTASTSNLNLALTAGQKIFIQYSKTGGNTPSDSVMGLFVENS